ncbi:MAG TPA: hypothetical protein DEF34_06140 [Desulfotomaculum sp.]|nr:MAG: hypothetical protein VR67_16945 [Peptococcaceae bacterium BRH_c8a]KJS72723.1 MAG: hypothetical protein JL56_12155 [Desulfotomaculum sp. BICA1-6]HBX23194.1 hypothetical protein [Desulfotomaculum sp.]
MKSQELGSLLITIFDGYSLKEVVAYGRDDSFNKLLKEKLGEDKYTELDRLEPLIWLDALRSLYFHYLNKQKS